MNFQTDLFVGGTDGYHTYRIPVIVATKRDTVLCFAEGRKTRVDDSGDIDLLLKRSEDGGKTWAPQTIVHEEGGNAKITIGNPCPIVDRDGTIHLLMTRNNRSLLYSRSTDDGVTWSQPADFTASLKGFDFATLRVGTGPVPGIQVRSGRLIAPIWLNDAMPKRGVVPAYRSAVLYSDDAGKTWGAGGVVPPTFTKLNECVAIERADDSLMLNMRGAGSGVRSTSISTDGGLNWSEPKLEKQLPCSVCQAALLKLPSGELLFSNPAGPAKAAGKQRSNMTVRLSADEGMTWNVARSLYGGPAGYSGLVQLQNGTLLCVFENGPNKYLEKISVVAFNLDWLKAQPSRP